MNKQELVNRLQESLGDGYSKKETAHVLDSVVSTLKESLREGEAIKIYGLGTFSTRRYDARLARNPRTNEPVQVPESRRVHFKPSKTIIAD